MCEARNLHDLRAKLVRTVAEKIHQTGRIQSGTHQHQFQVTALCRRNRSRKEQNHKLARGVLWQGEPTLDYVSPNQQERASSVYEKKLRKNALMIADKRNDCFLSKFDILTHFCWSWPLCWCNNQAGKLWHWYKPVSSIDKWHRIENVPSRNSLFSKRYSTTPVLTAKEHE